jgi:predicted O-methyltransferase YrrM
MTISRGSSLGLRRALGLLWFILRQVASPASLRRLLLGWAAVALEEQSQRESPIPILPAALDRPLASSSIVLPAAGALAPGNQDLRGMSYLVALARAIDAHTVFEFGTYNGLTALTLARNLPQAVIHTLDLPTGQPPKLPILEVDRPHLEGGLTRVYVGHPEEDRIIQHLADSALFDFSTLGTAFDLVYIDGAHSFDYVRNDTAAAERMLGPSGAIVWDDYWWPVPDVVRFLDALAPRPHLYRLPATRLVAWLTTGAVARVEDGAFREAGIMALAVSDTR